MSPIKAMPLLLAAVAPFVMVAGVARAAEAPLILAQYSPQQKDKDDHKQQPRSTQPAPQPKPQPPQVHPVAPQPRVTQPAPQPRTTQPAPQPQPRVTQPAPLPRTTQPAPQPQPRVTQPAPLPRTTQPAPQPQPRVTQPAPLPRTTQPAPQPQPRITQPAPQPQPRVTQPAPQPQPRFQGGPQPLPHSPASTQPLHQAHPQPTILRHELSAEEKRAKAERESHAADRMHLIEKQKQMASHEKSQAAVNERLRLQNERLRAITSQRQQSVDHHGQTVIKEPGNRTILQVGGHAFIQHDETAHFRAYGGIPQTRRGPSGNTISTIVRPDGVRIEIEVDSYGRPLRRVRHMPDGRRFILFENRALAIGAGLALGALIISLPPVEVDIPPEQYIVDADVASEDDIYGALQAGPIVPLERGYSLEEVLASVSLRQRMRSINIGSINFDFGSWEVGPEQGQMLESVAAVMRDMTNQNPGEVFLIEGHTDAVGSDIDNLSLSDRRAGAVADVLSQQFGIPRENLVTQGYGKQFLLIPTPEPEHRNRRVVVRRITPLLQADAEHYSARGGAEEQEPR